MKAAAVFAFAALAATFGAHADMFKCMNESGTVSYSDEPCKPIAAPAKRGSDSFAANVLIVKSHSDIETWVKLEPAQRRKDVGRMRTVTREAKIYLPVVATFSRSQEGERVALVADIEILAPDGKAQRIRSCCMANRLDPRAPATIVLNPVMDVTFDARDPKGEYKVRATLNNGKETVVAEEAFRLQ
jgi:hypothetical protein